MTNFGDPAAFASMCFDSVARADAQRFNRNVEEYDEAELRLLLTYLRLAYKQALKAYGADLAQSLLLKMHDKVFVRLAKVSRKFAAFVLNGKHAYLGGHTKQQAVKYKALARKGMSAH